MAGSECSPTGLERQEVYGPGPSPESVGSGTGTPGVCSTSNCGGQYDGHTPFSPSTASGGSCHISLAGLGNADDVCVGADRAAGNHPDTDRGNAAREECGLAG